MRAVPPVGGMTPVPWTAAERATLTAAFRAGRLPHALLIHEARGAGGIERMTADHAFLEFQIDRGETRDDLENLQSFADDLWADAVTFEN